MYKKKRVKNRRHQKFMLSDNTNCIYSRGDITVTDMTKGSHGTY